MDGVCDHCGNLLTDEDYITECGHIICGSKCYSNDSICPVCKRKCLFMIIGEKVPRDATGFLKPVKSILEDATDIINFRIHALTNLIQYQKTKIAKQKHLLNQAKHELRLVREYKWEIYHLKRENQELRSKLTFNRSRESDNVNTLSDQL